jgi:hypothetical protein
MKKMFLISIVFVLMGFDLFSQRMWQNPTLNYYDYLSIYFTGTKTNIPQYADETIEKMVLGSKTQLILLRKEPLDLPSIFFTDLNKQVAIIDSAKTSISTSFIAETRKLFREFILSISLFNCLIEQQIVSKSNPEIKMTKFNQNTTIEVRLEPSITSGQNLTIKNK